MGSIPPSHRIFSKARFRMMLSLPMACPPNTIPASLDTTPAEGHSFASTQARFSGVSSTRKSLGTRGSLGFCFSSSTSFCLKELAVPSFPALDATRIAAMSPSLSAVQPRSFGVVLLKLSLPFGFPPRTRGSPT